MENKKQNHINIARKLKALADGGVDGERESAREILKNYMRVKNLKWEDIDDEATQNYKLRLKQDQEDLATAIYGHVVPDRRFELYHWRSGYMEMVCTKTEFIKIKDMCKHYWKAYQIEQKKFFNAFMAGNALWRNTEESKKWEDLTEEEQQAYEDMLALGAHLKVESNRTKLENKN